MKEMDGFTSVYCATQTLNREILTSLAEYAGCHLFGDRGDVIYANESFVAVHAKDDGERTIRFKAPCSPYEVYEKRYYGHNTRQITVNMALGDTLMWCVGGEM